MCPVNAERFSFLALAHYGMYAVWISCSQLVHSIKVIFTKNCNLDLVLINIFVLLIEHNNRVQEALRFHISFKFMLRLRQKFLVIKVTVPWVIFVDELNMSLLDEFSLDYQVKAIEWLAFNKYFWTSYVIILLEIILNFV